MKNSTNQAIAPTGLAQHFFALLEAQRPVCKQDRTFGRMCMLAVGMIFAFGRHTVTQGIFAIGRAGWDWTAWYRLFSRRRIDEEQLAERVFVETCKHVGLDDPYLTVMDTTQLGCSSHTRPGSSWAMAPQTAFFKRGLARARRFLTVAWLPPMVEGYTRAIPIRFLPAFSEKAAQVKPRPARIKAVTAKARSKATAAAKKAQADILPDAAAKEPSLTRVYKPPKAAKAAKAPGIDACKDWEAASEAMFWLRKQLDKLGRQAQLLVTLVDGAFDKAELWRQLPERTILIARTAKNRALFLLPGLQLGRGRKKLYGEQAPSPQQVFKDRAPWSKTTVDLRGREIKLRYKVRSCFLRKTASNCPLVLLVIGGASWRSGGKWINRDPAYFLVNAVFKDDTWQPPFDVQTLLEWLWQRWEVEVTHRELKTGFGIGEMQCWGRYSSTLSVQWMVWLFALMMLAGYRTWGLFGAPKLHGAWWPGARRWSFNTVWRNLRAELWRLPEFRALCLDSGQTTSKFMPIWLALSDSAFASVRG